ncbi:MAG: DUF896 domain-containing protein [Selenomonadaceae bacterium]|nr:DUF896 domain-containing protein [Selenomonadaceae bacterium]
MITPELLARINELARKKRSQGLSEEELREQKRLYEIYLSAIRGQVINLLDSIEFVDNPADDKKISKKSSKKKEVIKQTTLSLETIYH